MLRVKNILLTTPAILLSITCTSLILLVLPVMGTSAKKAESAFNAYLKLDLQYMHTFKVCLVWSGELTAAKGCDLLLCCCSTGQHASSKRRSPFHCQAEMGGC